MVIKFEDGKMLVKTEYNVEFIRKAKELQGKWKNPYWQFPEENEEFVRDALFEFYGEDGRVHDTVTIDINLDEYDFSDTLEIGSVIIAERPGRDRSVRLHKNAMVVSGGFYSRGGSVKNPCITCSDETIVRVNDFPVEIYERIKDAKGISVVNEEKTKHSLLKERERILARLKEIDALLEERESHER